MSSAVIVVGVDESASSQTALEWAVGAADRQGCAVTALHVWRWNRSALSLLLPDAPSLAAAARESVETQVEKALANRAPGAAPVRVEGRVVEGDPASALLSAADDASLLVLGTHGQGSRLRRVLSPPLGSVASHCLSQSGVPVALIPSHASSAPPRRIVVGVDGSPSSAAALRWAVAHARATGAPVIALLAWQLTTVPPPSSTREDWSVPPLAEWEAVARSMLEATVDSALDEQDAAGVQQLLLHRPAAAGVLETVRADDLLVLGERGRGGFDRLLLGSVSRQCAEHAPCPVVIVPSRVAEREALAVPTST